ncbi:MAG: methylenetetrahydrofolate reductase [NAD(P)H] [Succinivibrionaceae bacterium]
MNTSDLFNNKTVFSFEVFPSKREDSFETIEKTFKELKELNPDFISVTYGAGGSDNVNMTAKIAEILINKYNITTVAHLTGIGLTKEKAKEIIDKLLEIGVKNILALRGDYRKDLPMIDFKYAQDLVSFIKKNYPNINVIGACYPEVHVESPNLETDIIHLKEKVNAGTSQLISQLFFENNCFYNFLEKCKKQNINVPIQAGIMPVINKKQIERIVTMCGAHLPSKLCKILSKYENNPESLTEAGIDYAVEQIIDLINHKVDGIHLYTMNNPKVAATITNKIKNLFIK